MAVIHQISDDWFTHGYISSVDKDGTVRYASRSLTHASTVTKQQLSSNRSITHPYDERIVAPLAAKRLSFRHAYNDGASSILCDEAITEMVAI